MSIVCKTINTTGKHLYGVTVEAFLRKGTTIFQSYRITGRKPIRYARAYQGRNASKRYHMARLSHQRESCAGVNGQG